MCQQKQQSQQQLPGVQPDNTQRGRDPFGGVKGDNGLLGPHFSSPTPAKSLRPSPFKGDFSALAAPQSPAPKPQLHCSFWIPRHRGINARKENKTPTLLDICWHCHLGCALSTPVLSRPGGLSLTNTLYYLAASLHIDQVPALGLSTNPLIWNSWPSSVVYACFRWEAGSERSVGHVALQMKQGQSGGCTCICRMF